MPSALSDPATTVSDADDRALRRLVALFADAAIHADADAFAALWTDDGRWSIAEPVGADFHGRDAIRDGFSGLIGAWEFLIQAPQYGLLAVDGDTATGRWLVREVGRTVRGAGQHNDAFYHDRYARTADGWRFAERAYAFLLDDADVAGRRSPPVPE